MVSGFSVQWSFSQTFSNRDFVVFSKDSQSIALPSFLRNQILHQIPSLYFVTTPTSFYQTFYFLLS